MIVRRFCFIGGFIVALKVAYEVIFLYHLACVSLHFGFCIRYLFSNLTDSKVSRNLFQSILPALILVCLNRVLFWGAVHYIFSSPRSCFNC